MGVAGLSAGGAAAMAPAYGIGLVSRLPVRSVHTISLPSAPVSSPVLMPGGGGWMVLRDEPRVAIVAVLDTAEGPLTVVTTHLSFVPGWNVRQLRAIRRAVHPFAGPCVLLGDLNLPGRLPEKLLGWDSALRAPTFPSPAPKVQFDHILLRRPAGVALLRSAAVELAISDHRAVVVDIDRAPPTVRHGQTGPEQHTVGRP